MKNQVKYEFTKNAIYGSLVITPLAVIFLFMVKLVEVLEKLAVPLGLESSAAVIVIIFIAIALVLLLCFVVGSTVNRLITFGKFEESLLKKIPGYEIISNIVKGFAKGESSYPAALVKLSSSDAAVFAFVMEENDNDLLTVFVPATPALTVGTVYIVNRESVTLLETSVSDIMNCVSQWGIGTKKVLSNTLSS